MFFPSLYNLWLLLLLRLVSKLSAVPFISTNSKRGPYASHLLMTIKEIISCVSVVSSVTHTTQRAALVEVLDNNWNFKIHQNMGKCVRLSPKGADLRLCLNLD